MRKVLVFFIGLGLVTSLHACLCVADIVQGFNDAVTGVKKVLNEAEMEIQTNVNPALEKNIEDIEEQNKLLEKIIVGYTERNVQKKEMIFLLNKLKNMQD